ncbi:MAG: M48 family metallopeptidase [Novosphingobium sp.]|nr:M48 family metallopeptidase [Novosphingobium sp.]MBP6555125.1 M48 family metallopeptidase [Novosphingobium sp.]
MIDSLGPEALAKAQAYTTGNHWLLLIGAIVSILIGWVIVRFKLLDRVADKVSGWKFAFSTIAVSAAFFAISDLLELPWTIYTDWQRQHAYGLSKQPLGDFMGQWAIGEAVSLVLGALFMWGIYSLIRKTGARWWLWGGGFTAIVVLLTLLAAPSLIEPLFNKYQPVPAGPVLTALEEIADDVGIPHDRIFMFDGSRQSERFTANVAGIGPTARIAISDVALKEATLAEVRAVTGHEAGHYKLGHVWRAAVIMPLLAMLFFFLLNRLFAPTARLLGSDATLGEPRGLPVFMVVGSIVGLLITPITNNLTRIGEKEADAYSLKTVNEPDALATALVKTAEYRYPRPSALQEFLFYTHPSVENRVLKAMEWKAAHPKAPPTQ